MRCIITFLLIPLSILIFYTNCSSKSTTEHEISAIVDSISPKIECKYAANKTKCNKIHSEIKTNHTSENERRYINFIADSLLPCWYGTKWNFYGTTEKPGEGTIACGYFVTTVIRDAGIPIQRIKMAQCASEEMIKTICTKKSITRFSNVDIETFTAAIKKMGFGLYVVGLDNHTGIVLNNGKEIYFIHSTYIAPGCVIKEEAIKSLILKSSKYKVIGKVLI